MGKQQQVTDDLEERRRVTRELNEATRDARYVKNELSQRAHELAVLLEKITDLHEKVPETVRKQIDALVLAAAENIAARIKVLSDDLATKEVELFGFTTIDGFLDSLGIRVLEAVREDVLEAIDHSVATYVQQWLDANLKVRKLQERGATIAISVPKQ